MTYTNLTIALPEERVADLYEFLASLTRASAPVRPEVEVEREPQPAPVFDDRLRRFLRNVMPAARDMLLALAERAEEELRYEELSAATGQDIGGPLKSLQIQSTRLGMDEPIHKRVASVDFGDGHPPRKRKVYWMDAATAAEVLRILKGGA
jgi:hypothetical protein